MFGFCAAYYQKVTGYASIAEQAVTPWNRTHPRNGALEEAKLDVATRDAVTGNAVYFDASIACAPSDDQSRQPARSGLDGRAAQNRKDDERRKVSASWRRPRACRHRDGRTPWRRGGVYVRSLAHGIERTTRTGVLRYAWQQFSCLLHVENAEALLAAMGT